MALPVEGTAAVGGDQAPPDLMRAMLAKMLQTALAEEFDRFLGAGRWERSEGRQGWRNGTKRRRLHTRVGTIELRVPKDREGRFQPTLFDRYQRSEKAFVLALIEMYIQGVSTRKVQKVVEQLCGVLVSASQVSSLVKQLDGDLGCGGSGASPASATRTWSSMRTTRRCAARAAWSPPPCSG